MYGISDAAATHGDGVPRDEELVTAAINEVVAEEGEFDRESDAPSENVSIRTGQGLQRLIVSLPTSTLVHPRSVFARTEDLASSEGFTPSAPLSGEWEAIQSLLRADPSQKDEDYIQFELDNFSCYVDTVRYPFEMRALHDHATRTGDEHFYFDGILRVGDVEHYVHKVRFDQIPLGNYGKDHETGRYEPTVGDQLWVLSKLNERRDKFVGQEGTDIYYQLKNPSIEYARFHNAFLWVADLAKHVVDFCEHKIDSGCNVSIHHFKEEFSRWIRETHKLSPQFLKWYKQRTCDDFRQSVVANEGFISKEVFGVLASKSRHIHLFREIAAPFNIYKRVGVALSSKKNKNALIPHTIVTPYIYECFSRLHLGQLLKPVLPSVSTEEAIRLSWPQTAWKSLAFTRHAAKSTFEDRKAMTDSIKPGDLISTPPDEKNSGTQWMTEKLDKKWFGLVQRVCKTKKGTRFFDVIWLYQPDDTPCCSMKYPWEKELFLGNHCTCDQGIRCKVGEDQVINVHSVEWFGSPSTQVEFFVRQTYLTAERRFVTLEREHLSCEHKRKAPAPEYAVGDTVLALAGSALLEPYELLEFLGQDETVRLRRLRRRREYTSDCAPNELVYTEEDTYTSITGIVSKCIVRLYCPGETVPAPYNRNGTGNAFFITHRLRHDGSLEPLGSDRPQLRQGFDPTKPEKKLRALDLFCGCGNFGRGIEDGGAVQAKWANDIWETAIHTYMANTEPGSVNPFLGSIDDLLNHGLCGKFGESVPRPGEVDVISGGSPCPGFSQITTDKTTLEQKKNRSLVASFASCIDFWRPRWGILENVKTIVQSSKNRTEDFFSQLICALVGMGYQAQIILGDAWAHGNPQTRVRAFLYFAAPGVNLPTPPYPSHSNPKKLSSGGLGKMANGEPYVYRTDIPTAFRHVTAAEATADLPDIYDAKPDTCIPFPDHRLSIPIGSGNQTRAKEGEGKNRRTQVLNIPMRPYNVNFAQAFYRPRADGEPDMFPHERDAFPSARSHRTARISKGWGRAHPHKLFSTITTFCHVTDARIGGNMMHWDQPRSLSIMETRRAQGVPDDEVLCGKPADQWEMVGNGVARGISTALGLSLREAWRGSLFEDTDGGEKEEAVGGGAGAVEELTSSGDGVGGWSDIPWAEEGQKEDGMVLFTGSDEDKGEDDDDDDDDIVILSRQPSVFGSNDAGKRPLSTMLAEEVLLSSSHKRARLLEDEEEEKWGGPFLPPAPAAAAQPNDQTPVQTPGGASVVRMSSAELFQEEELYN